MARTLKEAEDKLLQIESAKPKDYSSAYRSQMDALSSQMKDRKFNWNPDADALYQQYADRYRQQGKLAMKDSMGQTAALTGGYGNSYGSAVGQQTYDAYLQALSDAGLGIYDRAYSRYKDAGDALAAEYGRLADLDDADYKRYADALDAWRKDRDYYTEAEDTAYQRALLEAANTPKVVYTGNSNKDSGLKKNRYEAVLAEVRALDAGGSAKGTIQSKIDSAYNGGYITENQKDFLTGNWGSGSKSKTGNTTTVIKKPGQSLKLA